VIFTTLFATDFCCEVAENDHDGIELNYFTSSRIYRTSWWHMVFTSRSIRELPICNYLRASHWFFASLLSLVVWHWFDQL